MARTLPRGGSGSVREDDGSTVESEGGNRFPSRPTFEKTADSSQYSSGSSLTSGKTSRTGSRQRQAMGDAQESLNSLLQSPADNGQPTILSSSGAVRNTRGRVASPTARTSSASQLNARNSAGQLIEGSTVRSSGVTSTDSFLAIVPPTQPLFEDEDIHEVSKSRVSKSLQVAGEKVQYARDRVGLIIKSDGDAYGLGPIGGADDLVSVQSSRRHAARWASRYATHLVILVVVGALVAFGGLKALTVQSAFPNGLAGVDNYGTDYFAEDGSDAADSADFELTLPRTELAGLDASNSSRVYVAPVEGNDGLVNQRPSVRTSVTAYTVQAGDTVDSIAAKLDVMPETVMGSNGIWDSEEELAAGRILQVPPIDGMYYIPAAGESLEAIARKFAADPSLIKNYAPNRAADGTVKAGEPLVIPGGMMPMREVAITYVTRKGDTLKSVASRFGVDVPTIVRANTVPDPAAVPAGTSLRILPVAGMEYRTQTGDTVFSVADKFGVSTQPIMDFAPNGIASADVLPVDKLIMVPGGSPPAEVAAARLAAAKEAEQKANEEAARKDEASNSSSGSTQRSAVKPAATKGTVKATPTPKPAVKADSPTYSGGSGTLGWPIKNFVITQYFSGSHNGLDIAAPAGTNIYAAGSGTVIWSGWRTDGLGYCVFIDHGNGLTTVYGHMIRQPRVYVGQHVSRGQLIGNVGSTGHSTGPHTHFMVKVGSGRNYRNPLAYLGSR